MKPPAGADPARWDAHRDRRGAAPRRMWEIKVGCRKFTDRARRQARLPARVLIKSSLFAYGFLKVTLHYP